MIAKRSTKLAAALLTGLYGLTGCGGGGDSKGVFTVPGETDTAAKPNADDGAAPGQSSNGTRPNGGKASSAGKGTTNPGGGDDPAAAAAAQCNAPSAADAPLRRLTDLQYRNSVHEIFEGVVEAEQGLPASQTNLGLSGFSSEPDANVVTDRGAEEIADAADALAVQVTAKLEELLPCYPAAEDDACAASFVDTYAERAFRRPLSDDERALLLGIFDGAPSDMPFAERLGLVSSVVLQLPQFLYLVERGEPAEDQPNVLQLTGYEVASRLSYLFWDSSPDTELLRAAKDGELGDAEGIDAQARRLLEDSRAQAPLRRFVREWLQLPALADSEKDADKYPDYDSELANAFEQELDRFIDHALSNPDATPASLLTATESFVNRPLAEFYGIDSKSRDADDWQPARLDEVARGGLLARPALLAGLAYPGDSSPIHRGKLVLTRLFCIELPSPPDDALARQPETSPDSSQKERSMVRRAIPECAGCHEMMDPIGLALEEFDGIGQRRDHYADGSEVTTEGEIKVAVDIAGPFDGVEELGERLAGSNDVRKCMARQWLRYSFGRMDGADDACLQGELERSFAEADYSLRELFLAVTRSPAFRFRRVAQNDTQEVAP